MAGPDDEVRTLYRRVLLDLWTAEPDDVPEMAAALVTDDFVVHQQRMDGTESEARRGPAALAAMVADATGHLRGMQVGIDVGPIVDGDLVAARWTLTGAYRGTIPGATAPPGTELVLRGHDIMRVHRAAGAPLFCEYWVISDGLGFMTQLGLLGDR